MITFRPDWGHVFQNKWQILTYLEIDRSNWGVRLFKSRKVTSIINSPQYRHLELLNSHTKRCWSCIRTQGFTPLWIILSAASRSFTFTLSHNNTMQMLSELASRISCLNCSLYSRHFFFSLQECTHPIQSDFPRTGFSLKSSRMQLPRNSS